jgi:hypothetical protein
MKQSGLVRKQNLIYFIGRNFLITCILSRFNEGSKGKKNVGLKMPPRVQEPGGFKVGDPSRIADLNTP